MKDWNLIFLTPNQCLHHQTTTSLCKRTSYKKNLVVFWIAVIDWNLILYVICARKKGRGGGLKGEENYQMHMAHLHGLKIYLIFFFNLNFFMNIVTIKWLWYYEKTFTYYRDGALNSTNNTHNCQIIKKTKCLFLTFFSFLSINYCIIKQFLA